MSTSKFANIYRRHAFFKMFFKKTMKCFYRHFKNLTFYKKVLTNKSPFSIPLSNLKFSSMSVIGLSSTGCNLTGSPFKLLVIPPDYMKYHVHEESFPVVEETDWGRRGEGGEGRWKYWR